MGRVNPLPYVPTWCRMPRCVDKAVGARCNAATERADIFCQAWLGEPPGEVQLCISSDGPRRSYAVVALAFSLWAVCVGYMRIWCATPGKADLVVGPSARGAEPVALRQCATLVWLVV